MCDKKLGDLNHFMLWCPAYNEERGKDGSYQRLYLKNEDTLLGELLFKEGIKSETKETIYKFWRKIEKKKKKSNLLKL